MAERGIISRFWRKNFLLEPAGLGARISGIFPIGAFKVLQSWTILLVGRVRGNNQGTGGLARYDARKQSRAERVASTHSDHRGRPAGMQRALRRFREMKGRSRRRGWPGCRPARTGRSRRRRTRWTPVLCPGAVPGRSPPGPRSDRACSGRDPCEAVGSDGRRTGPIVPRITGRRLESVPDPFDSPLAAGAVEAPRRGRRPVALASAPPAARARSATAIWPAAPVDHDGDRLPLVKVREP